MPKHSSSRRSAWSDWVYSEEHDRYYCYKTKKNGEVEYKWDEGASSVQQQQHQQQAEETPRHTPDIEEITEDFDNLTTTPDHDSGYDYSYGSQVDSHEAQPKSKSRRKGKATATDYPEPQDAGEPEPEPGPEPEPEPVPDEPPLDPFYGARMNAEGHTSYETEPAQEQFLPTEPEYSQTNGYDPEPPRDYETEVREAISASDQQNFGYAAEPRGSSTEPTYGAYSAQDEGNDGQTTPKAGRPVYESEIVENGGRLDSRYKVEPSGKFKQGAIFKVVWSEPRGSTATAAITDKQAMRDPYGGLFYVGPRRFVVVATDEGHSTCVPILTYGGRGCGKSGVKPLKHGIIHEKNRSPHKVKGEPDLGFDPVKARLNIEGERLSKESRINYAKLTTIEHNVKVFFIGSIVKEEIALIRRAVDYCWEQKY